MVALPSHSLISAPVERRPAVWPWLVMPLVTLALFFTLFRLHKQEIGFENASGIPPASQSTTEP